MSETTFHLVYEPGSGIQSGLEHVWLVPEVKDSKPVYIGSVYFAGRYWHQTGEGTLPFLSKELAGFDLANTYLRESEGDWREEQ